MSNFDLSENYRRPVTLPTDPLRSEHRALQKAARDVLAALAAEITPDDTEHTIAAKAYAELCRRGLPDTWYYRCPALVLLGSRSCLSISGRDYRPAEESVGRHNLVTVDVSPSHDGLWGDCARSFYIEDGRVTLTPQTPEFAAGKRFIESLHAEMRAFVGAETTFHELFAWATRRIAAAGFETLDFLANVGHSIATRLEDRQYIEAHNHRRLCEAPLFTFEPHVRTMGGRWGFKHENIFFFRDGRVEEF